MRDQREKPDPRGNAGTGPESYEAGNLRNDSNTRAPRSVLLYQAPGEPVPSPIRVSRREAEMLQALRGAPATRAELAERRPRLGLSGPQIVERLRHKGICIESVWREGADANARPCRFVAYALKGSVLGVTS